MTGEEPLNLKANGALKLDRKSIKLRLLTRKSSSGTETLLSHGITSDITRPLCGNPVYAAILQIYPLTSGSPTYSLWVGVRVTGY